MDEGADHGQLTTALRIKFGGTNLSRNKEGEAKGKEMLKLKFLLTSRSYLRIRREFQALKDYQPTTHLKGEGRAEADHIAEEIAITIE